MSNIFFMKKWISLWLANGVGLDCVLSAFPLLGYTFEAQNEHPLRQEQELATRERIKNFVQASSFALLFTHFDFAQLRLLVAIAVCTGRPGLRSEI